MTWKLCIAITVFILGLITPSLGFSLINGNSETYVVELKIGDKAVATKTVVLSAGEAFEQNCVGGCILHLQHGVTKRLFEKDTLIMSGGSIMIAVPYTKKAMLKRK